MKNTKLEEMIEKTKPKGTQLGIWLPERQAQVLKSKATELGVSVSQIIKALIEDALERNVLTEKSK